MLKYAINYDLNISYCHISLEQTKNPKKNVTLTG